jgi:hypothetical protein
MEGFYNNNENFEILYKDISMLLSEKIIESSLAENWLANWYVCNKYNTTKALEKYAADLIIPKLKYAEIPCDNFRSIIDKKLSGCYESYNNIDLSLEDKIYLINNSKNITLNESVFSYIIQDFECNDIVSYIEEGYFKDEHEKNRYKITEEFKEVVNILSYIKNDVLINQNNNEKLNYIKDCNTSILYKHKYVVNENYKSELDEKYMILENILDTQSDVIIEYSLSELNYINNMIDYINDKTKKVEENFIYEQAINKFNSLIESIFFEDTEIEVDDFISLYEITEALCEYELTLEASSRIITKGTEKLTKAAGNLSAKSSGLSASDSKIGQIKRGAKIVDDRASDAINNKIDQILNFTREQKREKLITGKNTIRLSKVLKTIIGIIVAGGLVKSHPIVGAAITIIGLLGARGLSKATEVREKRRIMLELETELKITREKIEDAKGENAKEKKYQLMRIESELEKEIFRIKHGMKYY